MELGFKCENISKFFSSSLSQPSNRDFKQVNVDLTLSKLQERRLQVINLTNSNCNEDGIHIFAFINNSDEVIISCAGTMLDKRVVNDFDPQGPGFQVYEKHKKNIISKVNLILDIVKGKSVIVTGHSLGGAYAQYITRDLLLEKKRSLLLKCIAPNIKPKYQSVTELRSIATVIFQSAGVNQDVIAKTSSAIHLIRKLEKTPTSISFVTHFNQKDLITSLDGGYLYSDLEQNEEELDITYIEQQGVVLEQESLSLCFLLRANVISCSLSIVCMLFTRLINNYASAHKQNFYLDSGMVASGSKIYANNCKEDSSLVRKYNENKIVPRSPILCLIRSMLFFLYKNTSNRDMTALLDNFQARVSPKIRN